MKPDFKTIDITKDGFGPVATPAPAVADEDKWLTPELIPVKPIYTKEDLQGLEHLHYVSGIPPFLRGPYSAMYPLRPWTIRQYAGFSTAAESNAFPAATWPPVRKVFLWHLTLQRTADMMLTTLA